MAAAVGTGFHIAPRPKPSVRPAVDQAPSGRGREPERLTDTVYQTAYKPVNRVVLKHIPASAHFIMWDQSDLFREEVVAFLG
jgi:hypothetical protein